MEQPKNSLSRFSDRVENYVKYRPTYPKAFFDCLKSKYRLSSDHIIVDVGSGTGISSRPFLENGNTVYAVEPNAEMRAAAENLLGGFTHFHSLSGQAESTQVPSGIADFILAAQSFHWFDQKLARAEFKRIAKASAFVVLVWNDREVGSSEFAIAYEALIAKFGLDYKLVNHKNFSDKVGTFLGPHSVETFPNFQTLNWEGLLGRVQSSSYAPKEGDPQFPEMKQELHQLFQKFETNNAVVLKYETKAFIASVPRKSLF